MKKLGSARGSYNTERKTWEINISSLLTCLIKRAGECESYSSDILYDIKIIDEYVHSGAKYEWTQYFGFRELGVDGNGFIRLRRADNEEYLDMYALEYHVHDDELTMELYELEREERVMEDEQKIVLKHHDKTFFMLWIHESGHEEYVVCSNWNGHSWDWGHYFTSGENALEYYEEKIGGKR